MLSPTQYEVLNSSLYETSFSSELITDTQEKVPLIVNNIEGISNSSNSRSSDRRSSILNDIAYQLTFISDVNLQVELDLEAICNKLRMSSISKNNGNQLLTIKLRSPKATGIINKNGKMICIGGEDFDSSLTAARKFARIIQKLGYEVKFNKFRVRNILGNYNIGKYIDLHALHSQRLSDTIYDPEVMDYMMLFYRQEDLKMMIYKNGKVVVFGLKNMNQAYAIYDFLNNLCCNIN